jgi:hypothetical protein
MDRDAPFEALYSTLLSLLDDPAVRERLQALQ